MVALGGQEVIRVPLVLVVACLFLCVTVHADERPPVLLFFTADWCGACQRMKPAVERVAKRHPVRILDWDRSPEEIRKWNVRLLPTSIALKRGKEAGREVGIVSEERLEQMCKGNK